MSVHVATTSRDGSGTIVSLRGVADEDLVVMLTDGIRGILAVDSELLVDSSKLSQPRTPTGRTLLDQLLGDRNRTVVRGDQVVALDTAPVRT